MDRVDLHLGIGLDTSELRRLAKDLRAAKSPLAASLRAGLRAAAQVISAEAKIRAEEASATIPPSIKVRVFNTTIAVVAGGEGIPLAGLMELGNKGTNAAAGVFRAPNFPRAGTKGPEAFALRGGHDQPMHPYLGPAAKAKEPEFDQAVVEAIDGVLSAYITGGG